MLSTAPSKRALLVIAVLAFAVRLFALWAIPYARDGSDPNYAPDEQGHLIVAHALAHDRLLHWPEDTWSIYSVFPPSHDVLQAATLALGEHLGLEDRGERFPPILDEGRGYFWARLGSAIASTFACLFLACAIGRFARDARAGILAGLACAFHPQLAFLGAYCNPDAITICAGAALTAALAIWVDLGEGRRGLWLVGAASGFVLATKASGFFILIPTALWLLWSLRRERLHLFEALPALTGFLLVCAPPLILNAIRNHGDPFGIATYNRYLHEVWKPKTWPEIPAAGWAVRHLLPASTFGLFGNMTLRLPIWELVLYGLVLVLGMLAAFLQWPRARPERKRAIWWMLGALFCNAALQLHHMWFVDFQPQGRYILLSSLFVLCIAMFAPARLWRRMKWFPFATVGFLFTCSMTMEWLLYTRGR